LVSDTVATPYSLSSAALSPVQQQQQVVADRRLALVRCVVALEVEPLEQQSQHAGRSAHQEVRRPAAMTKLRIVILRFGTW
jgi:hypothetical protein